MADDADLAELIAKIHDQSFGTYGAPRVTAELRLGLGRRVNHKRVQRLMRVQGLQGVTRRRRTKGCTRSRAGDPRSDEAGTSQPTLDVLRRLATELAISADTLLFDPDERVIPDDLAHHLEAINQLDPDEKTTIRQLIEGALLRHQARKLAG